MSCIDVSPEVIALGKHYAAYGAALGGLNGAPAELSERTLREFFLRARWFVDAPPRRHGRGGPDPRESPAHGRHAAVTTANTSPQGMRQDMRQDMREDCHRAIFCPSPMGPICEPHEMTVKEPKPGESVGG